ncbi:MAG: hypothetical protein SPF70_12895 [Lachnospiraceae bacterium]|nr:hypothetical protein [Lachnospiraceae bacterium]
MVGRKIKGDGFAINATITVDWKGQKRKSRTTKGQCMRIIRKSKENSEDIYSFIHGGDLRKYKLFSKTA